MFEAKQLRATLFLLLFLTALFSHLSYIPQVSFLGIETVYFMLSSVCFV